MLEQKEREADIKIEGNKAYVVRLDGCKFGKFTEPFNKPIDNRGMYLLLFIFINNFL